MKALSRLTTPALLSLVLFVLVGNVGCEPDAPTAPQEIELTLNVKTVDLAGKPLAAVTFYINKQKVGVTFDNGEHKNVKFPVKMGDTVTFDVDAPDGYKLPSSVDKKQWRVVIEQENPRPVDLTVEFERPEREYIFLVQSGISHAAVTVDGRTVARTDDTGNVIFRTKGTPSKSFQAKVGDIVLDDKFSEGAELYVLNESRVGPVGRTVPAKKTVAPAEESKPKETKGTDTTVAIVQPTAVTQVIAKTRPKLAPKKTVAMAARPVSPAAETVAPRSRAKVRRQPPRRTRGADSVVAVTERQESPRRARQPSVETVGTAIGVVGDEAPSRPSDDPIAAILNEPEDPEPSPRRPEPEPAKPAAPVVERTATAGGLLPMDDSNAAEPPRQKEREPAAEPIAGGLLAASGPKVDKQFASSKQTVEESTTFLMIKRLSNRG